MQQAISRSTNTEEYPFWNLLVYFAREYLFCQRTLLSTPNANLDSVSRHLFYHPVPFTDLSNSPLTWMILASSLARWLSWSLP